MDGMNLPGIADIQALPLWLLIAIPAALFVQSTWLFLDARKRSRFPWFWALWGLIQIPMPLLLYWLIHRVDWRRAKRRKPRE